MVRRLFGIRGKISAVLIISNIILGLVLVVVVGRFGSKNLRKALIDRGRVIAQNLATNSADLVLEKDRPGIKHLITNNMNFESLKYIVIYDDQGNVLSDTFNGKIPPELKMAPADISQIGQNRLIRLLNIPQLHAESYDIWYPIEDGYIGYVRLGMSTEYVQQVIVKTIKMISIIIFVITLFGILVVIFFAGRIINPILYLAKRADEISQGKLEESISIKTGDEIEQLAAALERLRESVKIALERLKKYQSIRM